MNQPAPLCERHLNVGFTIGVILAAVSTGAWRQPLPILTILIGWWGTHLWRVHQRRKQ